MATSCDQNLLCSGSCSTEALSCSSSFRTVVRGSEKKWNSGSYCWGTFFQGQSRTSLILKSAHAVSFNLYATFVLLYVILYTSVLFHVCFILFSHSLLVRLCPRSIFAVTVSSEVTGGNAETLCAQVQEPSEPLTLTVSLTEPETTTVILEEAVQQDFYRCLTFQVGDSSIWCVLFLCCGSWIGKLEIVFRPGGVEREC